LIESTERRTRKYQDREGVKKEKKKVRKGRTHRR